ncbi:hypothetical protein PJ267_17850 [Arthrobacter sp. OVS8]|nr:hypothetical protein PJ267_17850 [Arthrobacter sp. OVS8]
MRNIQAKPIRWIAVGILALAAFLVPAPLAAADRAHGDERSSVIRLPGATGAEGIAAGEGSTFFAGDRLNGNIFRGDIDRGTAKLFIKAPKGRAALGMKVDRDNELLFVAAAPPARPMCTTWRRKRPWPCTNWPKAATSSSTTSS